MPNLELKSNTYYKVLICYTRFAGMSQASTQKSFLSRFLAGGAAPRNAAFSKKQVESGVRLDFPMLDLSSPSIHWNKNVHLLNLVNLPRRALSGPVQEDKADAHALLKNVVTSEEYELAKFDLCDMYGFNTGDSGLLPYENLDRMTSSEVCRCIRIISMRDFEKVLNEVIPGFADTPVVELYASELLGLNYFWSDEQNTEKLACLIVYARRRGIPLQVAAKVTKAVVSRSALRFLSDCYHVLAMPASAWSDKSFMRYLIDFPVPYVRLPISRGSNQTEVLLLPRQSTNANILGEGLIAAGAQDAAMFLLDNL